MLGLMTSAPVKSMVANVNKCSQIKGPLSIKESFVCIKLITPFNSLDATDDNKNKSLSVFLTLFGNMISSCHFEKSTLNKTRNHVVLLTGFTEFHVGIRTKHVRK